MKAKKDILRLEGTRPLVGNIMCLSTGRKGMTIGLAIEKFKEAGNLSQ